MTTTTKAENGAAKRRAARERTIGVRVSDEEYAMLEEHAWKAGKVVAEYSREILLNTVGENMLPRIADWTLCEVVAVRLLLLNLLPAFAKSEMPGIEEIKEFVAQVDQEKLAMVRERIKQWKSEEKHS